MKTEEEIQQLFEQVKHLIESDEPIDNPYEVQPHSFREAERSSLLDVFPDNVTDDMADKFLQHLALAIGTFHRLNNPKEQPLANLKARKKLKSLCVIAMLDLVKVTYSQFAVGDYKLSSVGRGQNRTR